MAQYRLNPIRVYFMWTQNILPRFADTDALGHINNTVLPVWFEDARTPIFRFFTPDLNPKDWHLIVAKIEVEYTDELFYGQDVEVRTFIGRIGNTSFVVEHEVWQSKRLCARGNAVMVHYDHAAKVSCALPETIRKALSEHLVTL